MTLHAITSPNWNLENDAPVALFLHGFGSNERDLEPLAQVLPAGMRWATLRAPVELGPGSYAWFHITSPGNPDPAAADAATSEIWAWVDAELPAGTVVVPIGFSQGGLMASQLLRSQPARVVAPVILGGFVMGGEQPADAQLRESRPAVFSGRGAEDQVITAAAVERTNEWLPAHATLTSQVYPGLAHGINGQELADVQAFLAQQLTAVSS
ncbi:phospholipase/carboxylesterase [Leucobacter exalbidus]|uniref:Phospholipase/carboxylesterase n=1 Tax=Leucobacter exalbidus TaxID=662960 RepID=A0A940PKT5_9MICO|nr:dienelactone hydrolase family protein [Leucobacter exalbidus]MBP1324878.1 phospholipase/carboxylesterase [Leucobacter exalbidus]